MSSPRMVIGDAPRHFVHAGCARPGEVVLGEVKRTDRSCGHCRAPMASGLVVQAGAPKETYRTHRR